MNTSNQNLDDAIINRVKSLNGDQKTDVLDYLDHLPRKVHSTRIYRRKAMKQIREALDKQNF